MAERSELVKDLQRTVTPMYPWAAALGVVCGVCSLLFSDGWFKLLALVWVVAVPLWLRAWWAYRRDRS